MRVYVKPNNLKMTYMHADGGYSGILFNFKNSALCNAILQWFIYCCTNLYLQEIDFAVAFFLMYWMEYKVLAVSIYT